MKRVVRRKNVGIEVYERLHWQPQLADNRCLRSLLTAPRRLIARCYHVETQGAVRGGASYRWRFARRQISGRTSPEDQLCEELLTVRPFADAVSVAVCRPTENYLHGENSPVPQYRFTGAFRSDWVYKSTAEAVQRELVSLQDMLWWRVHRGSR